MEWNFFAFWRTSNPSRSSNGARKGKVMQNKGAKRRLILTRVRVTPREFSLEGYSRLLQKKIGIFLCFLMRLLVVGSPKQVRRSRNNFKFLLEKLQFCFKLSALKKCFEGCTVVWMSFNWSENLKEVWISLLCSRNRTITLKIL